jgi:hypothetical protein
MITLMITLLFSYTQYILDKSAVAAVIIGVRLGIVDHINNNSQVFTFSLDK